jgi:hypothetical protein
MNYTQAQGLPAELTLQVASGSVALSCTGEASALFPLILNLKVSDAAPGQTPVLFCLCWCWSETV